MPRPKANKPPAITEAPQKLWGMNILKYRPALDNELACHWARRGKLKRDDVTAMCIAKVEYRIPEATTKRRVMIYITNKFGRFPDPYAPHKSLLDALVQAKLLVDDSAEWCDAPPAQYSRGELRTVITLEDIDAQP